MDAYALKIPRRSAIRLDDLVANDVEHAISPVKSKRIVITFRQQVFLMLRLVVSCNMLCRRFFLLEQMRTCTCSKRTHVYVHICESVYTHIRASFKYVIGYMCYIHVYK